MNCSFGLEAEELKIREGCLLIKMSGRISTVKSEDAGRHHPKGGGSHRNPA